MVPVKPGVLAAASALAAAVYLVLAVHTSAAYIAEDAAILLRYAQHLGAGLGYVWNPGEPPVDGATDWLSTTLLGALYYVGTPLELGPRVLAGTSHLLTIALVVVLAGGVLRAPLVPALLSAGVLFVGPARGYVQTAFLAPVFALTVLATWSSVVCAAVGKRGPWAALFGVGVALSTLTRPEGIVLAALMLAASWLVLPRPVFRRFVIETLLIAGPILILFAMWRWWYFGRLLPLPFLKKGGAALHWDGLIEAIRGAVFLLGWCVPLLVLGLRDHATRTWTGALVIVCGGFVSAWVLLSPEMNYFWRFQYALLPIAASTWWAAAGPAWSDAATALKALPRWSRMSIGGALAMLILAWLTVEYRQFRGGGAAEGLQSTAVTLRDLGSPDRRLVTTEAGLLPLYSGWHSTDSWGLNDPRIVAEGGITEQYLTEIDPDVIMFHAFYTPLNGMPVPVSQWDAMVAVMHRFAVCHGYVLAAAFAPELTQAHYYFVKPGWPKAQAFIDTLRRTRYGWVTSQTAVVDLSGYQHDTPRCGT